MKKLLLAVMMLFSSFALADRADDLTAGQPEDYCGVFATWFHAGAISQAGGIQRVFRELTPGMLEYLEHNVPLPSDSMFVPEWGSMTDNERALLSKWVLLGYDASASAGGFTRAQADEEAQKLRDSCMAK